MDLFNRDDYFTSEHIAKEKINKARKRFSIKNKEMTDTLNQKVFDSEKIDYSGVNLEVYKGVGL
ncbi:MAG: hypothetical protein AAF518_01970 [Spirochaetota bacterium]